MHKQKAGRVFRTFTYRDASYRIYPSEPEVFNLVTSCIVEIREELEGYIRLQPEFLKSLIPIKLIEGSPGTAVKMAEAARLTGTGPMAAVAGTIAEEAARRVSVDPVYRDSSIIIENGGDIFILPPKKNLSRPEPVVAGVFSGLASKFSGLALKIYADKEGTAICSSSSRMGHSLSFGDCDLCTVVSANASIADAAATMGCNLVKTEKDLAPAAERIKSIEGVDGVLIIKNDQIAIAGKLPELIKHSDPAQMNKITGTFLE